MLRIRALPLFVVIFIGLVISSCVAPTAQTPITSTQPLEETVPIESPAKIEVPSVEDGYAGPQLTTENIKLRTIRWQRAVAEEELFAIWIDEFEAAHPNITIVDEAIPFGQLAEKIQTTVSAGDPADILFIDGPNTKSYAYYNILLPLDDYLTEDFMSDIVPASRIENSYKGKLYSFPERQAVLALAYNIDMTTAAGIQPPTELKDAWTWDEALDAWKKLQQDPSGSGIPEVWGLESSRFGSGGAGFYFRDGIFSRSAGDPDAPEDSSLYKTYAAISSDGTTVKGYIDSPEAIEATQWLQDLTMKWNVTAKVGMPDAFFNKQAATTIDHDGLLGKVKKFYPDGGFNFTYTPIPYFKTEISMSGSNAAGVSAKTEYPAEAAAFLVYIYSHENALRFWDVNRGLPAYISLYEDIDAYSEHPYSLFHETLANIAVPRPSTPAWSTFDAIINAAIKDISLGAPVAETLHQAADDIDIQLKKYQ